MEGKVASENSTVENSVTWFFLFLFCFFFGGGNYVSSRSVFGSSNRAATAVAVATALKGSQSAVEKKQNKKHATSTLAKARGALTGGVGGIHLDPWIVPVGGIHLDR